MCFVELFIIDIQSGGKRDEDLILPINSSLSVTLHQDQVNDSIHIINPVSILSLYLNSFKELQIISSNSTIIYYYSLSQLKTTTTVACSRNFQQDRIWLNGKEEDINNPRLQSCLQESMSLAFRTLK